MVIASAAHAATVRAAIVVEPPLKTQFEQSSLVIVATCIGAAAALDEPTGLPMTAFKFEVDTVILGDGRIGQGDALGWTQVGGIDPSRTTDIQIFGQPVFIPKHRYLLFLLDGPWSVSPTTAWAHNTFEVTRVEGDEILKTLGGDCVVGIDSGGFIVGHAGLPSTFAELESDVLGYSTDEVEVYVENKPVPLVERALCAETSFIVKTLQEAVLLQFGARHRDGAVFHSAPDLSVWSDGGEP